MDGGAYEPRRHAPRPVRALVKNLFIDSLLTGGAVEPLSLNLNPAVGRGEMWGFLGTERGTTARSDRSPFHGVANNGAMGRENGAIRPVADSPRG